MASNGPSNTNRAGEPPRPVCLLTDFGTSDPYVGLMKAVIQEKPPYPPVIDLTHEVPPQNETAAAFLLEYCYPDLPADAVVLLVVDPMVGTDRRIVAYETEDGPVVVAPDRGLVDGLPIDRAVDVEQPPGDRDEVSSTFHGRDWFAPTARQLSLGTPLIKLGTALELSDSASLVPKPSVQSNRVDGEVVYVDRFGNLITNIPAGEFRDRDNGVVKVGKHQIDRFVDCYGNHQGTVALVGSFQRMEIAVSGGSASDQLDAQAGDSVTLISG